MEAVGPPALVGGRDLGEERVARSAPDALAEAVGEADREHVDGGGGQGHERAGQRGEPVPGDHERLAPGQAVGDAAGDDLRQRRHRLGQAPRSPPEARAPARSGPVRKAGSSG